VRKLNLILNKGATPNPSFCKPAKCRYQLVMLLTCASFLFTISTMIKNLMHEGKLVPSELIVKLLLKAMLQSGNDKFLVDGFPRNEENRQAYESIVSLHFLMPDSEPIIIFVLKYT